MPLDSPGLCFAGWDSHGPPQRVPSPSDGSRMAPSPPSPFSWLLEQQLLFAQGFYGNTLTI